MSFQSGSIDPASTTPAGDIGKIKNDLQQLRAVLGGTADADIPVAPVGVKARFANSADTNPLVLDWYEEGSVTPTVGLAGTPTVTSALGGFTRVGKLVTFWMDVTFTGGTTSAAITGVGPLPYAGAAGFQPVSIVTQVGSTPPTYDGQVKAYISGGTSVDIVVEKSATSIGSLLNSPAGSKRIAVAGSYLVA